MLGNRIWILRPWASMNRHISNESMHAQSKTTSDHLIALPHHPLRHHHQKAPGQKTPITKIIPEPLVPKIKTTPDTQPLRLSKTTSTDTDIGPLPAIPEQQDDIHNAFYELTFSSSSSS